MFFNYLLWLIHCGWDKMAITLQMTFSNALSLMTIVIFWLKFHWSLFMRFQSVSIGSNNGLISNRWQAIIWSNSDLLSWHMYALFHTKQSRWVNAKKTTPLLSHWSYFFPTLGHRYSVALYYIHHLIWRNEKVNPYCGQVLAPGITKGVGY